MTTQEELKASLKRELEELDRARGELRLQLHLANTEARDAWDRMERKWERIENELGRIGEHAKQPLEEVGKATRNLLDELKQGYQRVREELRTEGKGDDGSPPNRP